MIPFVYSCSKTVNAPSAASVPTTELSENSKYDGSVYWVKKYLQRNLKDPDSYQGIDWSPVQKTENGHLMVRHKYRAKNSLGGFVIENQVFIYDEKGTVHRVTDY